WTHSKLTEIVEIIGCASRLWPYRLAVIIVIADCRLVVNSVTVEKANCTLSLLPLSLPVGRRSRSSNATGRVYVADRIPAAIHDISQTDDQFYTQRGLMTHHPVRLVFEDICVLRVVVLRVWKQHDGKV